MPEVKTRELEGAALNWAVALAADKNPTLQKPYPNAAGYVVLESEAGVIRWNPAGDWAFGGQIIEREGISVQNFDGSGPRKVLWNAYSDSPPLSIKDEINGPTALVAAMRCFVHSKLGDTVYIPQEVLDAGR